MLTIAVVLLVLGLFLLLQATRRRKATGLPGGEIIYADTSKWDPLDKPLYDGQVGLAGKPDYLVRQGDMIIPVEVKSNRNVQTPFDSHIYQLAAYCRLVEAEYKVRPAYGILHYPHRTFRIEYTLELEKEMLNLLDGMRSQATRKEVHRSHQAPQRCNRCGYRSSCDQRIA
jgi:CRISPR-associated exonuclease Cas4